MSLVLSLALLAWFSGTGGSYFLNAMDVADLILQRNHAVARDYTLQMARSAVKELKKITVVNFGSKL